MEMVTLTINGQTVQAPKNSTILDAARSAGIYIPTLWKQAVQEALLLPVFIR